MTRLEEIMMAITIASALTQRWPLPASWGDERRVLFALGWWVASRLVERPRGKWGRA